MLFKETQNVLNGLQSKIFPIGKLTHGKELKILTFKQMFKDFQ